jgi:choline dehydrogenase-like flavoprotein
MTQSVELADVVIIGSGYGGSIPAYYLAASGAKVVVLERGQWFTAPDFAQTMQLGSYTRYLDLVVGKGVSVLAGNCVGGGSVVNLAAGLRAPSFAFNRVGSTAKRQWPAAISRQILDPWYDRVEESLPVQKQNWDQVSYAGGVFAAACHHTGRTCNPVPLKVDLQQCTACGWQINGCSFDAKRSLLLNYIPGATAYGAQVRPLHEVQSLSRATTSGYRYRVNYTVYDTSGNVVSTSTIEAKIVILAAGTLGTPVILQRSAAALGTMPAAVGRHFSANGDHISTYAMSESAISRVLGLQRNSTTAYAAASIGRPVGTMSYDGLNAGKPEFTRFSLQQIYFAPLTTILDQTFTGGPPWFGVAKKALRHKWASMLTVMAMTEDDNEGFFGPPPPTGSYTRLSADVAGNSLVYNPTANTLRGWAAADAEVAAILADVAEDGGPWTTEVMGTLSAHPLSSVRMGDDPATSALDATHELRGLPGIFVTDGAAIPTSLCVNPSLTISALAERAVPFIAARAITSGVYLRLETQLPTGATSSARPVTV